MWMKIVLALLCVSVVSARQNVENKSIDVEQLDDESNWDEIIAALKEDHEAIPFLNRSKYFNDMRNLIRSDAIEAYYGLDLMSYLDKESHPVVWYSAFGVSTELFDRVYATTAMTKYNNFILSITQGHLERLGFVRVPREPSTDSDLRALMIDMNCAAYGESCLNYKLENLVRNVEINGNLFQVCDGVRIANATTYFLLLDQFTTGSKSYLTDGLGCSLDQSFLTTYLDLIFDLEIDFLPDDFKTRADMIESTIDKGALALKTTLDFIFNNYVEIYAEYEDNMTKFVNLKLFFL